MSCLPNLLLKMTWGFGLTTKIKESHHIGTISSIWMMIVLPIFYFPSYGKISSLRNFQIQSLHVNYKICLSYLKNIECNISSSELQNTASDLPCQLITSCYFIFFVSKIFVVELLQMNCKYWETIKPWQDLSIPSIRTWETDLSIGITDLK